MADFALWATACETSLCPPALSLTPTQTTVRLLSTASSTRTQIAACVRELMTERTSWTGTAADLLRVSIERTTQTGSSTALPKNPRALAGHLRRAQTFLRALGIDVIFTREGRAGSRVIRIRTSLESTVSTVSNVSSVHGNEFGPGLDSGASGPHTRCPERRAYLLGSGE